MANIFDLFDDPAESGGNVFDQFDDDYVAPPPRQRGVLGAVNDTVITAANAIAGTAKAASDFVSPGNKFGQFIEDKIIKPGEAAQSDVVRAGRDKFQRELQGAESGWEEVKAVGRHVLDQPLQSLAMAAGTFVGPGAAVATGRGLALLNGTSKLSKAKNATELKAAKAALEKSATRGGLGGGAAAGMVLGGGDAAGSAYEMVAEMPIETLRGHEEAAGMEHLSDEDLRHTLATRAARAAQPGPAAVGALSGLVGAERLFAGAKGFGGNFLARGAKTALVEGGTEFGEEAYTEYSARNAAKNYDPSIDEWKGVAGAGAMGAALGGITGGALGMATRPKDLLNPEPEADPTAAPRGLTIGPQEQMPLFTEDEAPTPFVGPQQPQGPQGDLFTETGVRAGDTSATSGEPLPVTGQQKLQQAQQAQAQQAAQAQQVQDRARDMLVSIVGDVDQPNPNETIFNFNGDTFTSEEQVVKAVESQTKALLKLPMEAREAAVSYGIAVEPVLGRKPKLNEVVKDLKLVGVSPGDKPSTVARKIATQLTNLEGKGGDAALSTRERLGAWLEAIDTDGKAQAVVSAAKQQATEKAAQKELAAGTPVDIKAERAAIAAAPADPTAGTARVKEEDKIAPVTVTKTVGDKVVQETVIPAAPDYGTKKKAKGEEDGESDTTTVDGKEGKAKEDKAKKEVTLKKTADGKPIVKSGRGAVSVTREQLAARLKQATPEDKFIIEARTGLKADGQSDAPMTLEDVALAHAKRFRRVKPLATSTIQQRLEAYGIFDDIVTEVSALAPEMGELSALLEKGEAGDATGFQIINSPQDSNVRGDNETVAQRRERRKAEVLLARDDKAKAAAAKKGVAPETKADPEQDARDKAIEDKRRVAAEANVMVAIANAMKSPEKEAAARDWNARRTSGKQLQFALLPDIAQAHWIAEYEFRRTRGDLDTLFTELNTEYAEIANDQTTARNAAGSGDAATGGTSEVRSGGRAPSESGSTGTVVGDGAKATGVKVEVRKKRQVVKPAEPTPAAAAPVVEQSAEVTAPPREGMSTVAALTKDIMAFMGGRLKANVVIVQSHTDPALAMYEGEDINETTQGFVDHTNNKVVLIAGNIREGNGRSVFLHEVGGHFGLQKMLPRGEFERLSRMLREWAESDVDSTESILAARALVRVMNAKLDPKSRRGMNEMVAYFIEEAVRDGVNPTVNDNSTAIGRWFSAIMRAFTAALKRFSANPQSLTAQDIVDMAYGAAHMEMASAMQPKSDLEFSKADTLTSKLPVEYQKPVNAITDTIAGLATSGLYRAMFTNTLLDRLSKHLKSANTYRDFMVKKFATRHQFELRVDKIMQEAAALPQPDRVKVNAFLMDATTEQKWAYTPDFMPGVVEDPEMRARLNALPEASQALIKNIFKHGHDVLTEKNDLIIQQVHEEYNVLQAKAESDGDRTLVETQRKEALKSVKSRLVGKKGPYAPLKRFGAWAVVARSNEYADAIARKDKKWLDENESNEEHNYVEFVETEAAARARSRELGVTYATADAFEREQDGRAVIYGGDGQYEAFQRLKALMDEELDASSKGYMGLQRMVSDLYLSTLAESSARKSAMTRKNIAGANEDMLRAFATQGRADAAFIAALQHNSDVTVAMVEMRKEARGAPAAEVMETTKMFNEVIRRHGTSMDTTPMPVLDSLMMGTSIWMLLTSPAYYVQNALQTLMVTVPLLNGDHGAAKTWKQTQQAYKDVFAVMHGRGLTDLSKLPDDVRGMIQELADRGQIDITMAEDMGRIARSGSEDANVVANWTERLRAIPQRAEIINRTTAAIAAYRLAINANKSPTQAVDYAGQIVRDTHGDYSGFNAPRFMRGRGKIVFQFRKYQLIQLTLLSRLAKDSMVGASADDKAAARAALAWTFGHTAAMGGLIGTPFFAALGWALTKAFGDEEEPQDFELMARRAIGDKQMADLILGGVPKMLGVDDMKVGLGSVGQAFPFTDGNFTSKQGIEKYMISAMGPFIGGLVPRAAEGVGEIARGDYYKGLERLLPKGVADSMRGARFVTEGVTNKRGDVLLSPDELTLVDGLMQAVGFPTNTIRDRQQTDSTKYKFEKFYKDREAELRTQYTKAAKAKDMDIMRELRAEWQNVQASKRRNGFKPAPLQNLLQAPMKQRKRERDVAGGVQFTTRNQGFIRELADLND